MELLQVTKTSYFVKMNSVGNDILYMQLVMTSQYQQVSLYLSNFLVEKQVEE